MGLIIGLATYAEDIVEFIVGKSNREDIAHNISMLTSSHDTDGVRRHEGP